jgi:choice-of-anchor B domain-containing protein
MRVLTSVGLCAGVMALALLTRIGASTPEAAGTATMFVGFGATVLVGDGEVFVGEAANQFRPGTVYVYRKTGGSWQQAVALTGPNAAVGDRFGSSLALGGDALFVGAGPDVVHVLRKSGGTWSLAGSVLASAVPTSSLPGAAGPDAMVRFGAVAASDDWLLVGKAVSGGGRGRGARGRGRGGEPPPPPPAGAVFAFKRGADGQFAYQATITSAETETAGDNFGSAVVLSGTQAIIGASGQADRAGVVHELGLDADGTWKSQRTFAPVGVSDNDQFGADIVLNGDRAIVSAPGDAGGYGAVYIFRKVAQSGRGRGAGAQGGAAANPAGNFTWQELGRLASPAGQRSHRFGAAIAADEAAVLVGAPGAMEAGRVFVIPAGEDAVQPAGVTTLGPSIDESAAAGTSISLRGHILAVGASGVSRGGGAVIIYEREGTAWREQPMLRPALDELPTLTGDERRCGSEGKVEMFECGAADLMAFLPPSRLTHDGHYIQMNDIWGWTDPQTNKEWAIVGRRDGTTFLDITNPSRPIAVADLPLTDGARPNSWRDMKVYKDHVYIVADGAGPHGMQVFDLTRLRSLTPQASGLPQLVAYDALYTNIASAHNVVINEESGFAYPVGASGGGTTCGGGLHMVDIREPKKPTFVGCFSDASTGRAGTGYSHDAQCITYKGPDQRYSGHEICVGSNENSISIADVTDKQNPKAVSRATYPNVAYAHQGWFTDDHKYFYLDDEADEGRGIPKTRTMIWDLTDLENPKLAKEHLGVESTSDHNLYIKGDLMYQANYRSGLRVLSIRDPLNPREVAFFDTAPYTPNAAGYNGAWSVYPFFKSGVIIVSSIEQGLFIVRTADR